MFHRQYISFVVLAIVFGVLAGQQAVVAADIDTDRDGLTDSDEAVHLTNPLVPDTDGDGYPDGLEVANGYSPLKGNSTRLAAVDSDNDRLADALEISFSTGIGLVDTDGDGTSDYEEIMRGRDPRDSANKTAMPQRVIVDLTTQHLRYTVAGHTLLTAPVSTGMPRTPTPPGVYAIGRKVPVVRYRGPGYDYPNTKWNMEFLPKYFIHTAYWHNNFGKRTNSHGCVNMREADVEILYKYLDVGVPVEVIGKTPKDGRVEEPV